MDKNLFTGLELNLQGHLRIVEYQDRTAFESKQPTRELLNRRNAIHKENAAIMIAKAITDRTAGPIAYMFFGNGGTDVNAAGAVLFRDPNDSGRDCDLYNPVYFRAVDDRRGALAGDSMTTRHISNSYFSDGEIRCLIEANEPFGQLSANTLPTITEPTTIVNLNQEQFAFDEIGLKLADGTLVTHVIFVPIVKTASSLIEVVYTLRIAVPLVGTLVVAPPPPAPPPPEECHPAVHFTSDFPGVEATTQLGSFTSHSYVCLDGIEVDADTYQPTWMSNNFSVPDSHYGMAIVWSRMMVSANIYDIFVTGLQLDNYSQLQLFTADGSLIVSVDVTDITADTGIALTNDIVSWDTNVQQIHWMRDGVLLDLTGRVNWHSTQPVGFAASDAVYVAPRKHSALASPDYGVLYAVWYDHLTSFYDLTDLNNVGRIRSLTGQIIDPGTSGENITGSVPALYMAGSADSFANLGDGGTFVLV